MSTCGLVYMGLEQLETAQLHVAYSLCACNGVCCSTHGNILGKPGQTLVMMVRPVILGQATSAAASNVLSVVT